MEGFASYERSLLNLDNCYFITVELHAFQSRRTFFVTFLKHANYNAFTVARASNATIFLCVNEKRTGDIDWWSTIASTQQAKIEMNKCTFYMQMPRAENWILCDVLKPHQNFHNARLQG